MKRYTIGAAIAHTEQREIQRAMQLDLPMVLGKPVPIMYKWTGPEREVKLGCVFTQTAEEFGQQIYLEAWKRGWSHAEKKVVMGDGPNGSGISPNSIFRVRSRLSIWTTRANTCGSWRAGCIPMTR